MKPETPDWMDRLHEMRRSEEEKRTRDGITMMEWLHRIGAEADAVMAELANREQPLLARDKPKSGA